MTTVPMTLKDIYQLAKSVMMNNGCDKTNAEALADIIMRAERDGSHSHGLFRVAGYVKALRSGKVDGKAKPEIEKITSAIIKVHGNGCFAPIAQSLGLPALVESTRKVGIGALSLTGIHHFAALWPETEYLADNGLVGIACTAYMPSVAPAGSKTALFGTNPISFAWPRREGTPIVYDMATASMAMGDVQIALRDGQKLPEGTGLNAEGEPSIDPAEIIKGVLLPFGGYKGSAISLMVELLAAGLTGEQFSYEAKENDNGDGGPPRGGEIIIGISPDIIAGPKWNEHVKNFTDKMSAIEGVRLPGARRHKNRLNTGTREIDKNLLKTIHELNS